MSSVPDGPPRTSPYRRVVLKLTGASFAKAGECGIAMEEVLHIAQQTSKAAQSGTEIAIVIGGGNILRGAQFIAANAGVQETAPLVLSIIHDCGAFNNR